MTFAFRFHQGNFPRRVMALATVIFFALQFSALADAEISGTYGLDSRPAARAYLQMPERADGAFPRLLSQTGAFKAVSYTHLRAHETVLDLVCRLLLEKK